MSVEIFLITTKFWRFPLNQRVYDDFPRADQSPGAGCGVAIGLTVARNYHYGHESLIQRRVASGGNREKALREADLSIRAGLCDLGAFLRQDYPLPKRLQPKYEGVMRQVDSVQADTAGAVKCDLASEVLRSYGSLRFAAMGWSMLPAIWPGDTLVVERASADQLQVGEVALVGREGRLCAHRVVSGARASGNPNLITQGDAMPAPDRPVAAGEVLGRVAYIIRSGKCVSVPAKLNLVEQLVAKIVRRSFLAGRALVYLHRMVGMAENSGPKESVLPCRG